MGMRWVGGCGWWRGAMAAGGDEAGSSGGKRGKRASSPPAAREGWRVAVWVRGGGVEVCGFRSSRRGRPLIVATANEDRRTAPRVPSGTPRGRHSHSHGRPVRGDSPVPCASPPRPGRSPGSGACSSASVRARGSRPRGVHRGVLRCAFLSPHPPQFTDISIDWCGHRNMTPLRGCLWESGRACVGAHRPEMPLSGRS